MIDNHLKKRKWVSVLSIGNPGYSNSWKFGISIMHAVLFFGINSIAFSAFVKIRWWSTEPCILFCLAG